MNLLRKIMILAFAIGLFGTVVPAEAGPGASGGGSAVVCRNLKRQIISAEILDLYEARARGLKLIGVVSSVDNYNVFMGRYLAFRGAKAKSASDQEVQTYISDILESSWTQYIHETLPSTGDYTPVSVPKSCRIEQLAIFNDSAVHLTIQADIWSALSEQNRIALLAHEFFYRNDRLTNGNYSSDQTRAFVGRIFSTSWAGE